MQTRAPLAASAKRFKLDKYGLAEFATARATAQRRLYPSIFASNYLVLRNRRIRMQEFFRQRETVGHVLDVGAQYCPYYPLFNEKCDSYTSMDMVDTPIVDLVCNAEEMPVEDCSYDLVLCTQVLEHCTYPQRIVNESYRVLKPGGTLIVTVPRSSRCTDIPPTIGVLCPTGCGICCALSLT